jgi:hypothetical protein
VQGMRVHEFSSFLLLSELGAHSSRRYAKSA